MTTENGTGLRRLTKNIEPEKMTEGFFSDLAISIASYIGSDHPDDKKFPMNRNPRLALNGLNKTVSNAISSIINLETQKNDPTVGQIDIQKANPTPEQQKIIRAFAVNHTYDALNKLISGGSQVRAAELYRKTMQDPDKQEYALPNIRKTLEEYFLPTEASSSVLFSANPESKTPLQEYGAKGGKERYLKQMQRIKSVLELAGLSSKEIHRRTGVSKMTQDYYFNTRELDEDRNVRLKAKKNN